MVKVDSTGQMLEFLRRRSEGHAVCKLLASKAWGSPALSQVRAALAGSAFGGAL